MKLKTCVIKLINFYQRNISTLRKRSCVFYPTCSEYAKETIDKHGLAKGGYLTLRRLFRCHPWQKNHLDPVP